MIVCTRCGTPNQDKARRCERCGHKLQSSARPVAEPVKVWEQLEPLRSNVTPEKRAELLRMVEACLYSAALLIAAVVSAVLGTWTPLYAAIAVVAILVLVRRL